MMNWSAKDGARSSLHYGGEGVFIHPSYQGVCRRHGTEEQCVTPGGLARSSGGTEVNRPISRKAKWNVMLCEESDDRIVPEARRKPRDRESGSWVNWGSRSARWLEKDRT